jgi:hypothetical protein
VQRSVLDWIEPEDAQEAEPDPALVFHLTFTMPLLIGILVAIRSL